MDALAFNDTSVGTPLMVSGTHPVSPSVGGPGGINNVSTTKQVLDPSNGILVIASTSETDKYWHGWIEYPKPVPVVTIASPTTNTKVRAGSAVTFTGTATSGTDGVISTSIKWTSSRDGNIGAGTTLSTSSLSAGVHTITASATDSAKLTIDVATVSTPVLTLTAPANGKKFAFGAPVPFVATATDSFDGDLSPRILWTSDRDGAVGTGGSFNRATLSRGTHTLTASITDTAGLSASATTHVIVLDDAPPAVP